MFWEYGFGEYGFKHRACSWVYLAPIEFWKERAQWVPLSLLFVCKQEITEFQAINAPSTCQLNSVSSTHSLTFCTLDTVFLDPCVPLSSGPMSCGQEDLLRILSYLLWMEGSRLPQNGVRSAAFVAYYSTQFRDQVHLVWDPHFSNDITNHKRA